MNKKKEALHTSKKRSLTRNIVTQNTNVIPADVAEVFGSLGTLIEQLDGRTFESEAKVFDTVIHLVTQRYTQSPELTNELEELLKELIESDPALQRDILEGVGFKKG